MTAFPEIVSYTPAGAVPPSEREGVQSILDMLTDAFAIHDHDEETGEKCCTDDAPCTLRAALKKQYADAQAKIGRASSRIFGTDPEPTRPQGDGRTSSRIVADPARPAQIGYIHALVKERSTDGLPAHVARTLAEIQAGDPVSKNRASGLITALLKQPKKTSTSAQTPDQTQTPAAGPAQTRSAQVRTPAVTEDGMYRTPDGEIYKVQVAVHGSGRLYAKKLTKLDEPRQMAKGVKTHEFIHEAGALRKLTAEMKMSMDEMKAWGKLYETCCSCGWLLTDETSIDEGIGPVCGGRRKK